MPTTLLIVTRALLLTTPLLFLLLLSLLLFSVDLATAALNRHDLENLRTRAFAVHRERANERIKGLMARFSEGKVMVGEEDTPDYIRAKGPRIRRKKQKVKKHPKKARKKGSKAKRGESAD